MVHDGNQLRSAIGAHKTNRRMADISHLLADFGHAGCLPKLVDRRVGPAHHIDFAGVFKIRRAVSTSGLGFATMQGVSPQLVSGAGGYHGVSAMTARSQGELVGVSDSRPVSAPTQAHAPRNLFYDLFLLNIALQLFDGMATYAGVQMGVPEGNQLLCNSFAMWGVGPSLILFKAFACGLLLLLYRNTAERVGRPALMLPAAVYCLLSLLPWWAKLLSLALPLC